MPGPDLTPPDNRAEPSDEPILTATPSPDNRAEPSDEPILTLALSETGTLTVTNASNGSVTVATIAYTVFSSGHA